MEIIEITDANTIKTDTYLLLKYDKFEEFNPVQSSILPFADKDNNCVISAATSSGKTVIAEFFITQSCLQLNKKVIYVCPLKALASEKYSEWKDPSHDYSMKNIGYFTEGGKSKNDDFDIGIFTIEGLCHKLITKTEIFKDVDVIVIDEAHLLGAENRGHFLEFALMYITKICPCRIVFLSGTLANGKELAQWLCNLNKKQTIYLKSTYRPVPLNIHYRKYEETDYDDGLPSELVESTLSLVKKHPNDKFLVFVHSKATGKKLKQLFLKSGHTSDFHCADLKSVERNKIEKQFKNGDLRILVATSTLAAGVNLPARRVIVFGVTRGKQFVDKAEIGQMMGRAGRKGIDTEGDVYIFIPESKKFYASELKKIDPIKSSLLEIDKRDEYPNLAFYILSLIFSKNYSTDEKLIDIIKTSFACERGMIHVDKINKTIARLISFKFIEKNDNVYNITKIGSLSCYYFIDPYDLFSYQRNFYGLIKNNMLKDSLVSYALANIPSKNSTYISSDESNFCFNYKTRLQELLKDKFYESACIKYGFSYWCLMHGNNLGPLAYLKEPLQNDIGRITSCLAMMSKICGWNNSDFFYNLSKRLIYGVRVELLGLVEIKNIGKIRAEKLYSSGFKNKQDVMNNLEKASKIAGLTSDVLKASCLLDQKSQQDIQS